MTRRGVAGSAVVVVAALILVWWIWAPPGEVGAAGVVPGVQAPAPEHERPAVDLRAGPPAASAEQSAAGASSAQDEAVKVTVAVRGSAFVTDEEGLEHYEQNGSIELTVWEQATGGINREVPVVDGSWSTDVAVGAGISVSGATLGERPATLVGENQRLQITEDRFIALRFRWPPD
jgi:hypothetical protein